ncbi:MAG: OPT/YSL family transporter [Armatimonadetes bacterium]|nr:OPT/YSL family transporter [Akkermansiaceae bacterium]
MTKTLIPEKPKRVDKEVEEFRNLMQVPSNFEDGFNWLSLLGAIFIAMIMIPGSIYMGLLAGEANIGPAAQWVTVILFLEVARRAQRTLKKPEIFVLFFMAGSAMQLPFSGLLWHQYYVQSDAASAFGIAEHLPVWFAPLADSESYSLRSFFHVDWLPVIGLVVFSTFFGQLSNVVLGYGLFRLTSDIEKLPFPMAPIGAQGILALAEDIDEKSGPAKERSWRWRVFSIGGALGLFFGAIYLGLPTLTGMITGNPIMIFPIPFVDLTDKTQGILPAVATGITWDLGNVIIGMVLPYYAMVGSFIGLLITFLLNPVLYKYQILNSWLPGDGLITTTFKNNVDFYFSFSIGVSMAIAIAGFWEVYRGLRKRSIKVGQTESVIGQASIPAGRGDIRPWIIIACYFFVTATYITVSGFLIDWHPGVMVALLFFGFVYTPLISYVTARLEGIAGQVVEIPMVREASLILSGYTGGVKVWFLPLPIANYGMMTVQYRQCELTGTKFASMWKTKLVLYPIILASSILFASFIWSLAEVPSAVYPYAQKMWELEAMNRSIIYSSTLGEYSLFEEAFRWKYVGAGAGFGVLLFGVLNTAGAPIFLTYGVVRGLGQSLPQMIIPQMLGALLGRYYFQRKLGLQWRQYVPVVAAGFSCGMGLITVACVGITFLSKAVIQLPF